MSCTIIHGVDIVETVRIRRAIQRWGDHFLNKVFTPSELNFYKSRPSSFASHFAAKEAVVKALGTKIIGWGYGTIKWHEIEILPDNQGKPVIYLHGKAMERSKEIGLQEITLSLSDTDNLAIASVVGVIQKSR